MLLHVVLIEVSDENAILISIVHEIAMKYTIVMKNIIVKISTQR